MTKKIEQNESSHAGVVLQSNYGFGAKCIYTCIVLINTEL